MTNPRTKSACSASLVVEFGTNLEMDIWTNQGAVDKPPPALHDII